MHYGKDGFNSLILSDNSKTNLVDPSVVLWHQTVETLSPYLLFSNYEYAVSKSSCACDNYNNISNSDGNSHLTYYIRFIIETPW